MKGALKPDAAAEMIPDGASLLIGGFMAVGTPERLIDALVFCGGIGENSRVIRRRVCERLGWMGIEIDHGRNAENATILSSEFSRTTVMIVNTREDLVIARAARAAIGIPQKGRA